METVVKSMTGAAKAFREGLSVGAENVTANVKELVKNIKYTGIRKAVYIDGIIQGQTVKNK